MREIGSEFWNVPTTTKENMLFPESTQWFISGRSALYAIAKRLIMNCKSVAIPSWCCESMIKPFADLGFQIYFYPVYFRNGFHQEIRLDCDVLLIMDYFGYTGKSLSYEEYDGVIIRDLTHSVFSLMNKDADYYFGSLRKWCGIWTGGYAWGDGIEKSDRIDSKYIELRRVAMKEKKKYILNGEKTEKTFLRIYDEAEELLEQGGCFRAADRDIRIAKKIDIDTICSKRRSNATVLMRAFSDLLVFPELSEDDCPMFVPIIIRNGKRDSLRRYLIAHSIYCPVHWPVSDYHRLTDYESFLYGNELSLVCDQRYNENDMDRIIETIKRF